jgi:hypothetical protein
MKLIGLAAVVLLVFVFALVGCTKFQESSSPEMTYEDYLSEVSAKCINLCFMAKDKGIDFTNGPCLGVIATDWVCDVAHYPRQSIDNLPENQCLAFREGNAHHFVEVNENCKVIVIDGKAAVN